MGTLQYLYLALSTVLPWGVGSLLAYMLLRNTRCWNMPVVLGVGFFLGASVVVLLLKGSFALGMTPRYEVLLSLLVGLALTLMIVSRRFPGDQAHPVRLEEKEVAPLARTLFLLVLASILFRLTLLAQEVMLRPLYPWDAWMNWAPKAVVWFHMGQLTPYVSPGEWMMQGAGENLYTLGNWAAWKYPEVVPLVQLWGMLSTGMTDHPLIYLPQLKLTASATSAAVMK